MIIVLNLIVCQAILLRESDKPLNVGSAIVNNEFMILVIPVTIVNARK